MEDVKKVAGSIFNNYMIKYATLIIAFLMLYLSWNQGRFPDNYINSDGKGYYAYLTAIFIYQDLDYNFVHDYEMKYYDPDNYFHFTSEIHEDVANMTFAGVAVLWLPFFTIAHVSSMVLGLPTDGYAPLYQYAIGFAAIFYLFLALWGLKKFLELYRVNKYHITLVQIILTFATPIYYYSIMDASFTHVYSFSMITLFFYYTKRYFMDRRAKHFYLASLLFGLIVLIRPTNLMVIAALPFIAGSWETLKDGILGIIRKYKQLIIGTIICGAVVIIQPLLYYAQVGEFFVWTYTDAGFNFTDPHITDVLISYKKGLFVYTPILLFSLLGFFHLLRRNFFEAVSLFSYMFLFTYVISSWWSWWYGMSYGHRAFLDHYVVFGLLFGMALGDNSFKIWRYLIYVLTPVLIVINMIQFYQYQNWILHWDMDEEKFWRVFLKTDESYEGLLWEEEKKMIQEEYLEELEAKFKNKVLNSTLEFDYEDEMPGVNTLMIDTSISRSENTSIRLSKEHPYSPGLQITLDELPDSNMMLIKASAWVFVPDIPKMNIFSLVCSIENTEGTYHYHPVDCDPADMLISEWNRIEIISENYHLKSPDDIMKVYIWYRGERQVYVDDLKVEFYRTGNK